MKKYVGMTLIVLAIAVFSIFFICIASISLKVSIFFIVIPYLLVGIYQILELKSWYITLGLLLSIIAAISFYYWLEQYLKAFYPFFFNIFK
jgi:hypothetical protein